MFNKLGSKKLKKHNTAILILITLVLAACEKNDLTRENAQQLLLTHSEIQDKTLNLVIEEKDDYGPYSIVALETEWNEVLDSTRSIDRKLVLRTPASVAVAVSGIAKDSEGSTKRNVEFSWAHVELPAVLKPFVIGGGNGNAIFQLFDDGWRIVSIESYYSDGTPDLSPSDEAELDTIVSAVKERREEAERLARIHQEELQKAREQRISRLQQAMTDGPGVEIINTSGRGSSGKFSYQIKIRSAHIEFPYNQFNRPQTIWFGNIQDILVGKPGNLDVGVLVRPHLVCGNLVSDFSSGPERSLARPEFIIGSNQAKEFQTKFNAAFSAWKKKHKEFVGGQWLEEIYGKSCGRL